MLLVIYIMIILCKGVLVIKNVNNFFDYLNFKVNAIFQLRLFSINVFIKLIF